MNMKPVLDRTWQEVTDEVDCRDVKFPTPEDMVSYALEVTDVIDKISIEANQYDLDMLYKEAQKLGLDIGDLEQYGFKLKGKHLQL